MMQPMLEGRMHSIVRGSREAPEADLPCPRRMAFSMLCLAKPVRFAFDIRSASLGFALGSGPNTGGNNQCDVVIRMIVRLR